MSRCSFISDNTPVKCLSEENRSGLATKNWVICSDDGYPFKLIPYQGKSDGKEDVP